MAKVIRLESPLAVYLPRKTMDDKKIILNLNYYRNWQHHLNNQIKQVFKELMHKQFDDRGLQGFKFKNPVDVEFQYFKPTKRISDKSNVFTVQSKFLYDAMVQYGMFEDDNDDWIKHEHLLPTVHDKDNPRCEWLFKEL